MAEYSASRSGSAQPHESAALPQDFETALAQLEALVARMESGELPLEQSLAAYERGVELSRICQRLLDAADEQVKVLQGNLLKPIEDLANHEG
ncbi:MAG: exodeoxyribonuclease VII small subunit [Pusillimonas sp.]